MTAISFSATKDEVMKERKNYSAPESMRLKESVEAQSLKGKTITIDECIVVNKIKTKDGKIVLTKENKPVYQPVVFVAFDKDKFFACKSSILVNQLVKVDGKKYEDVVKYEDSQFTFDSLVGVTVKIGTENVRYHDKKEYPQIIFVDA